MCYELKETATVNVGTKGKRFDINLTESINGKDRYRLSDEENKEFKRFFKSWHEEVETDLKILKSLSGSSKDSNGTEDTSPTFKVLEEGANSLSKEEAGKLIQRQEKLLIKIKNALCRIENKTFGRCNCLDCKGKIMSIERLTSVPLAMWCKKSELKVQN